MRRDLPARPTLATERVGQAGEPLPGGRPQVGRYIGKARFLPLFRDNQVVCLPLFCNKQKGLAFV